MTPLLGVRPITLVRRSIHRGSVVLHLLNEVMLTGNTAVLNTQRNRRALAVISFLALTGRATTRTRLAALIWEDREREQAMASLRQALYELRTLGLEGNLKIGRTHIEFVSDACATDLNELEAGFASGDLPAVAKLLRTAQNPPLDGLDGLSEAFDEWLLLERARIQRRLIEIADASMAQAQMSGQHVLAFDIAESFERLDGLDERGARGAMRSAKALGKDAEVHRRYTRLVDILRRELNVEPSPATQALYDELRKPPERQPKSEKIPGPANIFGLRRRTALVASAIGAALLLALLAWAGLSRSPSGSSNQSIAVLPFEDLSGRSGGYFASGVAEEVLNLLAGRNGVSVVGRSSAQAIAADENRLARARELGISHLLEGSLRSDRARLLVLVRLVRVSDGTPVWSERFERRPDDVFAIQQGIAQEVASNMRSTTRLPMTQRTAIDVYDRYLAARSLARERREKTLLEAERLLREAIHRDPSFAPAHAELAQVVTLLTEHSASYGRKPFEASRREAIEHARRAIELDPQLGDAYAALGLLQFDYASARGLFAKAVRLAPQRPEFHRWLGQAYTELGDRDAALAQFRRAVEIDPLWGLNYEFLVDNLYFFDRPDEAARYAARFESLSSDETARLMVRRIVAQYHGDWPSSFRIAAKLFASHPGERVYAFRYASELANIGEGRQAQAIFGRFDPFVSLLLQKNDLAVANEVRREGASFWVRRNGLWGVDDFLLASGHGNVLVDAYQAASQGSSDGAPRGIGNVVSRRSSLIIALRDAGRTADATRLISALKVEVFGAPSRHIRQSQGNFGKAIYFALTGDREAAIGALQRVQDIAVLSATPARSLANAPVFAELRGDARFQTIDGTLRDFTNRNRGKLGLAPIPPGEWQHLGRF